MNDSSSSEEPMDAVRALRARGIGNPEDLLQYGTVEEILTACRRWDARTNVGAGLLASWIRKQEFLDDTPPPAAEMSKGEMMRAKFAEYADRFPVGMVAEPHAQLQQRRWPDDEDICPGDMVVLEATYPLLTMRCDRCDFEAAVGVRHLHVIGAGAATEPRAF